MSDKVDPDTRHAIAQHFDQLQRQIAANSTDMEPFVRRESEYEAQCEELFKSHGVEYAGHCEFCNQLLFAGESGHADREGIVLCFNCAPTYGDMRDQLDTGAFDDPEDEEDARNLLAGHLHGGGSLDDKMLATLLAA